MEQQSAGDFDRIGKYKVLGTLGSGSMGVVYKAFDPEIGREVAIKVIKKIRSNPELLDTIAAMNSFYLEARSAGRLRHHNIVTVFDVGHHEDSPYIVMEYIDGQSLDAVIAAKRRLMPELVVYYMTQVAAGLDYAHSKAIVHRDIKPRNISIDHQENAYILDFGIARMLSGNPSISEPIMGTPAYMSPEQLLNRDLDFRSDIFSLAVVCFECLTGVRPFRGTNFEEVSAAILSSSAPSVLEYVQDLPAALDREFERALARNPQDRFESATQMVQALGRAMGVITGLPGYRQNTLPASTRRKKLSDWRPFDKFFGPPNPVAPDPAITEQYRSQSPTIRPRLQNIFHKHKPIPQPVAPHIKEPAATVDRRQEHRSFRMVFFTVGAFLVTLGGVVLWFGFKATTAAPLSQARMIAQAVSNQEQNQPVTGPAMSDEELRVILTNPREENISKILQAIHAAEGRALPNLSEIAGYPLTHDSYVVRAAAARALGKSKDMKSVPMLLPLLDDYDVSVRVEVVKALDNLGDPKAAGYLSLRLLKEDAPEVKLALEQAIAHLNRE